MSKGTKKWKKHVNIEAPEPRVVVTPTTWQVHRADISPFDAESTEVLIRDDGGGRYLQIKQFGETISLDEDEFEMVVQAGAQAFRQRWPK